MDTYLIEKEMEDPIAFLAASTMDADTLCYNQAMQAPDRKEFQIAMEKEVEDHESREHWKVFSKQEVPLGAQILQAVWSFKQRR
jgi:hypothetical protein